MTDWSIALGAIGNREDDASSIKTTSNYQVWHAALAQQAADQLYKVSQVEPGWKLVNSAQQVASLQSEWPVRLAVLSALHIYLLHQQQIQSHLE